jgi:hypothetical protein
MAGIDYSIPGQFKGIQLESPMNAMAQAMQLRNLQETSQMNALKTREAQETSRQRNALAQYLANPKRPTDPLELEAGVRTVAPLLADQFVDTQLRRADLGIRTKEHEAKTFELKAKEEERKRALNGEKFQTAVGELINYNTVTEVVDDIYQKEVAGEITPQQAAALRAKLPKDDAGLDSWRIATMRGLLPPKERLEDVRAETRAAREANKPVVLAPGGVLVSPSGDEIFKAPDREKLSDLARLQEERAAIAKENPADPRLKQYDAAIAKATATNQPLSDLARKQNELAELEEQLKADPTNKLLQQRIKEYRDDIRKDTQFKPVTNVSVAAPVTPVTIQDPKDPSKAIVVDGRTGKVIGASIKEGPGTDLTAKERQTREAKYPQATAAIKTYESKSEELARDLETLANHPGLDGISGAIYGRLPSGTKDSMAAQEKYNSIVARGGFKELADMRAASPTGGALGNVSNQEGQYLRDAFGSIGRTQSKDDLKAALIDAAKRVRESKGRIREAYDMTYEYRSGGSSNAAPAAPKSDIQNKADAVLRGAK